MLQVLIEKQVPRRWKKELCPLWIHGTVDTHSWLKNSQVVRMCEKKLNINIALLEENINSSSSLLCICARLAPLNSVDIWPISSLFLWTSWYQPTRRFIFTHSCSLSPLSLHTCTKCVQKHSSVPSCVLYNVIFLYIFDHFSVAPFSLDFFCRNRFLGFSFHFTLKICVDLSCWVIKGKTHSRSTNLFMYTCLVFFYHNSIEDWIEKSDQTAKNSHSNPLKHHMSFFPLKQIQQYTTLCIYNILF